MQEVKAFTDKKISDLEAELVRVRMEKDVGYINCGGSSNKPEEGVEELRAKLTERDADCARLEALLQERTQLVETRATELANLHVSLSIILQEKGCIEVECGAPDLTIGFCKKWHFIIFF